LLGAKARHMCGLDDLALIRYYVKQASEHWDSFHVFRYIRAKYTLLKVYTVCMLGQVQDGLVEALVEVGTLDIQRRRVLV
jgi:hypothetical protein